MNQNWKTKFKIGDKVKLLDGDGRTHIIKELRYDPGIREEFYIVIFEDDAAKGMITPTWNDLIKVE